MRIQLKDVAGALGLAWAGADRASGWSVDSRTLAPGDLFFALRGPHHDGNGFVPDALARGAVAAVAERPVEGASNVLLVPDALRALAQAAAWARVRWGGDVIGVTGSAGKTSAKDAIAACLEAAMPVGKTIGNLNNHVGLPLSILRLPGESKAAVLEMGMNRAGEIRELAALAKPSIGVVTNVGYAHIEAFESIEDIALAKRELVEALPPDGVAVLNADDPRVLAFARSHPGRSVTFGLSETAEVRAEDVQSGAETTRFTVRGAKLETALPGRHGLQNVLAGIAVASLYGIAPEKLAGAIRSLKPAAMRGERILHEGILIFDDCYNSNPDAALAMIGLLADSPAVRRIAVLGEMLELGRWSRALHRGVGIYAAERGIDALIGIRGAARHMVEAAIEAGIKPGAAIFFDDTEPAGEFVRNKLREGDAVLFKGSRGVHVENVLARVLQ